MENWVKFDIFLDSKGIGADRLDELTRQFSRELQNNEEVMYQLRNENLPDNAMSAEAFTIGALAIAVLPAILPALIEYIKDWQFRNQGRQITIKKKDGDNEVEIIINPDTTIEQIESYLKLLSQDNQKPK